MKWTREAEQAIKKAPFFVRRRVKMRVEEEARRRGKDLVSLSDLRQTQRRFLDRMSDEVKGFNIESCFGSAGCPNRAVESERLMEEMERILRGAQLRKLLEERVKGKLKPHHEFRVAISDCPNACSQPQIRDIGIIGACEPMVTDEVCNGCGACVNSCTEEAILMNEQQERPRIDYGRCLRCGKCIETCPTGTLLARKRGFRVLLGGKLGRHPRLAAEMAGLFSDEEVLETLRKCLDFYRENSKQGERFAEIMGEAESIDIFRP